MAHQALNVEPVVDWLIEGAAPATILALPLRFIGGEVHAASFATRRAGGFHEGDVSALRRVATPLARMDKLNKNRPRPLRFGIGLHLGELTYANVGTPSRIEFTVVGAAANEAARIESLCKTLGVDILLSQDVARAITAPLKPLGSHTLRGVGDKMELFTPGP